MKILLSPSKTQTFHRCSDHQGPAPFNCGKTSRIMRSLQRHSKAGLGRLLDLKGDLLDEAYLATQHWICEGVTCAFELYTGVTFEALHRLPQEGHIWHYAMDHIGILSALYGYLTPMTRVCPYRLDFTISLWSRQSLIAYWKAEVQKQLSNEDWLLDCASQEYAKLLEGITVPLHRVDFYDENAKGELKIISYNVKKMRGELAAWCCEVELSSPRQLTEFSKEGYHYDRHHSTPDHSVYVKRYGVAL